MQDKFKDPSGFHSFLKELRMASQGEFLLNGFLDNIIRT